MMEKMIFDAISSKEILVCQALEEERQRSTWYQGTMYLFNHKGYRFYIEAKGVVQAKLYSQKPQRGVILAQVSDLFEEGLFYETFHTRILTDRQLEFLETQQSLVIEQDNAFELFIQDKEGCCVCDSFLIPRTHHTEALRYVLDHVEEFLVASSMAA